MVAVTLVPLAATVWSWVGVAGIGVLLAWLGRLVVRANDRERAGLRREDDLYARLPASLRLPPVPRGHAAAALAAMAATFALGLVLVSYPVGLVAAAAVVVPIGYRITGPRREAERTVLARGRAMRDQMDPAEHDQLMDDLHESYAARRS